jgi:hypothetical protein
LNGVRFSLHGVELDVMVSTIGGDASYFQEANLAYRPWILSFEAEGRLSKICLAWAKRPDGAILHALKIPLFKSNIKRKLTTLREHLDQRGKFKYACGNCGRPMGNVVKGVAPFGRLTSYQCVRCEFDNVMPTDK